MDSLHPLLARQLRRQFGPGAHIPTESRDLVHDINSAYQEMEAERNLLERALEISSEEQFQANAKLRALLQATFKRECGVPLHHTVGNHDIYGWNKKKSGAAGTESDWGKKFACELYGQPRTYQTFDRGGWRFICLDSVQPKGDGYVGYLDDEQHEWLKSTIAGTPKTTPILIVSHIPILSLTALTYGAPRGREKVGEDTVIHAGEMHTDGTLLHDLFKDAGNVKVCLSGHTHLLDHCMIDGISYICDGAVSGSWWKGPLEGLPEGYGCLELRPDGTFTHEYKTYGWKAAKA